MVPSPTRRRLLSPSLLALALAIGTVAGAVGRDATVPVAAIAPAPDAPQTAVAAPTGAVLGADSYELPGDRETPAAVVPAQRPAVLVGAPDQRPAAKVPAARPAVEVKGARASTSTSSSGGGGSGQHQGRNHMWMPALGIDRSVSGFACSNHSYPGNRVYRWGCAGSNNIYLFGHAHSVFKPLHDAYVRGKLRKGQELFYADSGGNVHRYKVAWWKITTPTKGTWAYAAQATPSLTLQTCVGKDSQYRLIVRLTRAD